MITEHPMNPLERRTVSSVALLYCFRMLGLFMVLPLLALYAADLPGATPTRIGLALGIYGLSQALLQIPFGWLSDRIGRKPVIIGGLLLFAIGSVVAALADSVQGLILGRMLQGAGAIAGTVMALLADLTRDEQRTKAMAIVGASIGVSFALALILGPAVASYGGLEAVFFLTAGLALCGMLIVRYRVPAPAATGLYHAEVGTRGELVGSSLRQPELLRLNVGVFVLHFILVASFMVIPVALETGLGVNRDQHWQIYLPAVLLSLAGVLPLMRIAERGGRPRAMFACGIGVLGTALALLGFGSGAAVIYFGLWLFFVGFNYLEAVLPSLVSKSVSRSGRGTALGIYSTCQFFGAFAGGAGGGWLFQRGGGIALMGLCIVLALLWLVLALPTLAPAASLQSQVPEA